MAKKTPEKDINLYLLVAGPKKSTMKKGLLFTVLGIAAVVLMAVGFTSLKVYQSTQEKLVAELEEKTQDPALLEKIEHVLLPSGLPVMPTEQSAERSTMAFVPVVTISRWISLTS